MPLDSSMEVEDHVENHDSEAESDTQSVYDDDGTSINDIELTMSRLQVNRDTDITLPYGLPDLENSKCK